jgi:glycosyltransferase involved in cell wall biosynthesis
MTQPLVSVIIPTYNRAHLLARCIQSVLHQSYNNIEIIVVDDGSIDATEFVVSSFSQKNLRYIKKTDNQGPAAARNIGIMNAKGDFIAFNDSDDIWLPDKLEKEMNMFRKGIGVVYCRLQRNINQTKLLFPNPHIKHLEGNIFHDLAKNCFVSTPTVVIRSDCIRKIGLFDEDLPIGEDWDLFIRLAREYDFAFCDEILVESSLEDDSLIKRASRNEEIPIDAYQKILEKYSDVFSDEEKSLLNFEIGTLFAFKNEMNEARKYLIISFKQKPSLTKYFMYLLSFCGSKVYYYFFSYGKKTKDTIRDFYL